VTLLALQQAFRTWLTSEPCEPPTLFDERAAPGLAVYLNNYRSRLMSCLTTGYPAVRAWLGDTAFEAAAANHIDRLPPHDWSADAYGVDFPETLQSLHPRDAEIAELACLERELTAAFVGPDAEPFDHSTLASLDWDAARIHFVPTFTLLPVTTNVGAIWSALHEEQMPPAASRLPEPAVIAIWRDGLAPRFRTVTTEEANVLQRLLDGETFGAVCASLVAQWGEEQGAATAASFLGQWLSDRLIARVTGQGYLPAAPAQ